MIGFFAFLVVLAIWVVGSFLFAVARRKMAYILTIGAGAMSFFAIYAQLNAEMLNETTDNVGGFAMLMYLGTVVPVFVLTVIGSLIAFWLRIVIDNRRLRKAESAEGEL